MIALLLFACGTPAERTPSPDAVLPHPAGYDEAVHGPPSLAPDATCLSCHGIDEGQLVNGAPPSAPACRSCHVDYPHTDGYGLTADHGAGWLSRPSDCAACHGASGTDVPSEVEAGMCTSCHHTYPHTEGWDAAAAHGAAVFARGGPTACATCHEQSATGDAESGRCASCHAIYPHPTSFADPAIHAPAWEADAGLSCTNTCHPVSPDGAAPRVSCASCHDLFPHPTEWPDGHIAIVQVRGEGACARCHDPGTPAATVMPVSCGASCHATAAP